MTLSRSIFKMNKKYILLLEHYRKKYKLSYDAIVFNPKESFYICNPKTYKKMINGLEVIDKDELLIQLFQGIGRPLVNTIDISYQTLSDLIAYNNKNTILEEIDSLLKIINEKKNNALYDYHYQALIILYNYYDHNETPNQEVIYDFMKLSELEVFDQTLLSLVIIIFDYSYHRGTLAIDYNVLLNYKPQHLLMKLSYLMYLVDINNDGLAYALSVELEKQLSEDNLNFLVNYLPIKIELWRKMGLAYNSYYIQLKDLLINNNEISEQKKYISMINLANSLILFQEYEEALEYLYLIKQNLCHDALLVNVYMLFCEGKLNKEIKYTDFSLDLTVYNKNSTYFLYQYFMNDKMNLRQKNSYLLRIMNKYIDPSDKLYIFIIKEEITKNCAIQKHYKALYDFEQLLKMN